MKKIIIKNCPALCYGRNSRFKKCYRTNWKEYCENVPDCLTKRIYEKFKDCNCELIKYLELEEIDG